MFKNSKVKYSGDCIFNVENKVEVKRNLYQNFSEVIPNDTLKWNYDNVDSEDKSNDKNENKHENSKEQDENEIHRPIIPTNVIDTCVEAGRKYTLSRYVTAK